MCLTTTDFLLILNGWPLRTIFFKIILPGSDLYTVPAATSDPSCANIRTGAGGNITGANTVATEAPSFGRNLSNCKNNEE